MCRKTDFKLYLILRIRRVIIRNCELAASSQLENIVINLNNRSRESETLIKGK